jgi:hypothetical protein
MIFLPALSEPFRPHSAPGLVTARLAGQAADLLQQATCHQTACQKLNRRAIRWGPHAPSEARKRRRAWCGALCARHYHPPRPPILPPLGSGPAVGHAEHLAPAGSFGIAVTFPYRCRRATLFVRGALGRIAAADRRRHSAWRREQRHKRVNKRERADRSDNSSERHRVCPPRARRFAM